MSNYANTIRIKRRSQPGAPGAPTSLFSGELAFNENDSTLYIGVGTGGLNGTATATPAIAGIGAFVALVGDQTITGNKTFSGTVSLGSAATAVTPTTSDNSTAVATTAFVKAQNYLTANEEITLTGDVSGSGTTEFSVTINNGVVDNDKLATMVANTIKGRSSTNGTPEDLTAAQVKTLLAISPSDVAGFDSQVQSSRLDQFAVPSADVSMNTNRLTNLADPTSAQDAATKSYVDAARQGLDVKESVRAATVSSISSLSGLQTVDGVSLVVGDRVLVKNQSDPTTNGIYVVADAAWPRSADANSADNVTPGLFVFVEEGTANADTGWVLSADQPITLNSTNLDFVQFASAGQIVAGGGLNKDGNTLSVALDGGETARLVINASGLDLAETGVVSGSYSVVSVDAYGRVLSGDNPTTLEGHGITDGQSIITATGILVGDGDGEISAAVENVDFQGVVSSVGLLKGAGSGSISAAVAGTDYLAPDSTIDGGSY